MSGPDTYEARVEYVRDPIWNDETDRSHFDCVVKFRDMKREVPFTAAAYDVVPYGREIHRRGLAGEYGQIKPALPRKATRASLEEVLPLDPDFAALQPFIEEANLENAQGSIRGKVLVWSSKIEDYLGEVLRAYLVDHSESGKLLGGDGDAPLSTFSARTRVSFCLGLIDVDERRACDQIRTIRNYAAHTAQLARVFSDLPAREQRAIKGLYEAFASSDFHWIEDFRYQVDRYYCTACGSLLMRLVDRRERARALRVSVPSDDNGTQEVGSAPEP